MSQSGLAEASGRSQGTLSRYERGQKRPTPQTIKQALAPALGLDGACIDQLLMAYGYSPTTFTPDYDHPALRVLMQLMAQEITIDDRSGFKVADLTPFLQVGDRYLQARQAYDRRLWADAIETSSLTLDLLDANYMRMRACLLDTKATSLVKLCKMDEAEELFQAAREAAKASADEQVLAVISTHQGDMFRDEARAEDALSAYREALRLFARNEDRLKTAWVERKMGVTFLYKGEGGKAERYLQDALEIHRDGPKETHAAKYELAKIHLALGWAASLKGAWDEAVTSRKTALKLAEEYELPDGSPDTYLVMETHIFCGLDYTQIRDLDKAREHLTQAQEILHQLGEKKLRGHVYLALGKLYHAMGKAHWDAAEDCFEQASNEHKMQKDDARAATTLLHLSKLQLSQGKLSDALRSGMTALISFSSLDNRYYRTQTRVHLCRVYRARGELGRLRQVARDIREDEHNRPAVQLLARLRVTEGLAALDEWKWEEATSACADGLLLAAGYNDYLVQQLESEIDHSGVKKLVEEQSPDDAAKFYRRLAEELGKHDNGRAGKSGKRLRAKRDQLLLDQPLVDVIGETEWRWV